MKLSGIKQNPTNPRIIKDDKFQKLVTSIKEFPEMLEARPIVVNPDMIVLGGNMRLKAAKAAGLTEAPVYVATWEESKAKEFIVKDNVGFGQWDWDILANEWDAAELDEWGLDVWQPPADVDYSILDEEDLSGELDEMTYGVKKAIMVEFESTDYEEAFEIVKFWREREAYVGGMILAFLKEEKNKL